MTIVPSRRSYLLLVLTALLLHGVLAAALPVSGDEAYYWDCSRHPDWSYFDQPPVVIWSMIPFRAVLGETRLAVRAPAILASLLIGLFLPPLARRLGGGYREASWAYLALHIMPLFFIGSFYASTDIAMSAAYVGATWAGVALAQGERRAWWGFGIALGLGFLAKFPVIIVLPALIPALLEPRVRRDLATPVPYAAAGVSVLLTAPVWVWAVRHGWDNIEFQLAGRHGGDGGLTLKYLGEFLAANLILASVPLGIALAVALWRAARKPDPAWRTAVVAALMPFVAFGLVALRERVGAHWAGPGLMVAVVLLSLQRFRYRRALVVTGAVLGLALSGAVVVAATAPETLLGLEWSYRGRPHRISTDKLAEAIGNREIAEAVSRRLAPSDTAASESYTKVHLLAFLSDGELPTCLAHIGGGKHGLASLYWRPAEWYLERDMLFVTEKGDRVADRLSAVFRHVEEEAPVVIERRGRVVRRVRMFRCRGLVRAVPEFTRLAGSEQPPRPPARP